MILLLKIAKPMYKAKITPPTISSLEMILLASLSQDSKNILAAITPTTIPIANPIKARRKLILLVKISNTTIPRRIIEITK